MLLRPQNEISRYIRVTTLLDAFMIQKTCRLFRKPHVTILRFLSFLVLLHYDIPRILFISCRAGRWLKSELNQVSVLGSFYQIHILHTIGGFYEVLCTRTLRTFSH